MQPQGTNVYDDKVDDWIYTNKSTEAQAYPNQIHIKEKVIDS